MKEEYSGQKFIDFLVNHLSKIENIKNHVWKEFYKEETREGDYFKNSINEYLINIKKHIEGEINPYETGQWPLVLIGSIVDIQDLDKDEFHRLKITPPFYDKRGEKIDSVSCISPIGKALLLKRIGERVSAKIPLGNYNLLIKAVELPTEQI